VSKFREERGIGELHVIGALRDKRSEIARLVKRLEQQLAEQRTSLVHLDATMQPFAPNFRSEMIRRRRQRMHNAWFRPGECLRLIYDEMRDTPEPVTTTRRGRTAHGDEGHPGRRPQPRAGAENHPGFAQPREDDDRARRGPVRINGAIEVRAPRAAALPHSEKTCPNVVEIWARY